MSSTSTPRPRRREFLKAAAGVAAASVMGPFPALSAGPTLEAKAGTLALQARGEVAIWGYGGTSPGPLIKLSQGDVLQAALVNSLDEATTLHWHGIRVPNGMDGVPFLTQAPVAPGQGFSYAFSCADAGTYWYHPHANSAGQVGRGLCGAIVVEEDKPIAVDRDLVWVLADWRFDQDGRLVEDFGALHDASHAGRLGNVSSLNGRQSPQIDVRPGERLRLRLVNAAGARIFAPDFEGLEPWWVALDGQPIEPRRPGPSGLLICPGTRADLIVDIPAAGEALFRVRDTTYRNAEFILATLRSRGRPLRGTVLPPPRKLPDNPIGRPDLARAEVRNVTFEGGAMGGLATAHLDGEKLNLREMAARGVVWATNGRSSSSLQSLAAQDRLFEIDLGKSYVFRLRNRTAFPHPIHLHGHTFRILARQGKRLSEEIWRDTALVFPDEEVDIAFLADNPGDWLLHCHILGHAAAGMTAAIRVG